MVRMELALDVRDGERDIEGRVFNLMGNLTRAAALCLSDVGGSMTSRVRIGIVDDHPLYRAGLIEVLGRCKDFSVVGEADNAGGAMSLAEDTDPDVIVMDARMPGNSLAAAQCIMASSPKTKVVILTASERTEDAVAALSVGVSGYLLKTIGGRELIRQIRSVAAGNRCVAPEVLDKPSATMH